MIREKLLQIFWREKLFGNQLSTIDGQKVNILHPGFQSFDSGPDFLSARIEIDGVVWVGAVEIHRHSSDWYKHNHHKDPAYNGVILHVVEKYDKPVYRKNGEVLPTVEVKLEQKAIEFYNQLLSVKEEIRCLPFIEQLDELKLGSIIDSLLIDRLEERYNEILSVLKEFEFDWEQAFYVRFARGLGMKVNSLPMELLAKSIPLKILKRYKDDVESLEAILFGQSGLLEAVDEYSNRLEQLYKLFKEKYNLSPIDKHLWKFLRLRPVNFPTIRISQLANYISKVENVFSTIIEIKEFEQLYNFFKGIEAFEYWDEHLKFGKKSGRKFRKRLGPMTIDSLLINVVIPFIYSYGRYYSEAEYVDRAIEFLTKIDFEENSITKKFSHSKFNRESAADSQALYFLYRHYCSESKCLDCKIGQNLILNSF